VARACFSAAADDDEALRMGLGFNSAGMRLCLCLRLSGAAPWDQLWNFHAWSAGFGEGV
jgi:hypothetical protein